ncbi:MAG: aspartate aminotransferase family protein [Pirellulaceae bacterium]
MSTEKIDDSAEWLTRFRNVHPTAAARDHDPKFGRVFVRGAGARLWDVAGNDYIDLTCGYSAANFGQSFPPLIEAANRQLQTLTHLTGEPHVGRIALAERLLDAFDWPRESSQVMFNTTGARAIETAWKAATAFRPGKIATLGPAFHGRSLATLPLGQTQPLAPLGSLDEHILCGASDEYPYCAVCPLQLHYPDCDLQCVSQVLTTISDRAPEISAVLVEPAIGARGMIVPPAELFQRLWRIARQHGILLIADEIQTGLGRFGHLSLAKEQSWQPDLLVLGKSLGGGLVPISAVLGRRDVLECLVVGSESETFAASPLATAVASEVLEQLTCGPWIVRGASAGEKLRAFTRKLLQQHDSAASSIVEGQGACCVIEFGSQAAPHARRFAQACVGQHLLPQLTGPELTRVALMPPLTINEEELSVTCTRLQLAFADCMDFEAELP